MQEVLVETLAESGVFSLKIEDDELERKIRKRTNEGWELKSITPTHITGQGGVLKLTAIYSRPSQQTGNDLDL